MPAKAGIYDFCLSQQGKPWVPGIRRHDDVCGAGGSILRIPGIILGAEKIDPSVRSPWRGVEVATVPGLGLNGVRSFLPSVIDRSATHFEPWEPPGAEAEAGQTAAQQRGRTVRFDAIGVGGRGRCRLTSADDLQRRSRS